MIWLELAAQSSAGSAVAAIATTGTSTPSEMEPLVNATGPALWIGFGAFIFFMIIGLWVIIHGRVIKPAQRKARDENFFEPAGADVDITFDDPETIEEPARGKKKKNKRDKKTKSKKPAEQQIDPTFGDLEVEAAEEELIEVEKEEASPKGRSPFAGLFAKRSEKSEEEAVFDNERAAADSDPEGHGFAEVMIETDAEAAHREHDQEENTNANADETQPAPSEHDYWDTERALREEHAAHEEEERQRAEFEQAERERQRALAEAERARAEADAERQRYETELAQNERQATFERRKAEAALEQRMQSLATMQRKLDDRAEILSSDAQAIHHRMGASLDQRFTELSAELYEKLNGLASKISNTNNAVPAQALFDGNAKSAVSEIVTREIDKLRESQDAAISRLADRIDSLNSSQTTALGGRDDIKRLNRILAERTPPAAAGIIQLTDLVRNALPAERFAFDRKLTNGATADCMITPPGENAAFAIDARYPIDPFEAYIRAEDSDHEKQETIYRRAILRHMVFIAEKLIAPPETGDFAIMFVPSDTIFNDLHLNFADIVQDSYRARIWITSPTSLMATLHMMSAAAASFTKETAEARISADEALGREIAALSARLAQLEDDVARTRDVVAEIPFDDNVPFTPPDMDEALSSEASDDIEMEEADTALISQDWDTNPWRPETLPAEADHSIAPATSGNSTRDHIAETRSFRDAQEPADQEETTQQDPAPIARPPFPLR